MLARLYLQSVTELRNTIHGCTTCTLSMDCILSGDQTGTMDLLIEQTMIRAIKGRRGLTRGCDFTESMRSMWDNTGISDLFSH